MGRVCQLVLTRGRQSARFTGLSHITCRLRCASCADFASIQRRHTAYMLVCEDPRDTWRSESAAKTRVTAAFGQPFIVDAVQFGSLAHRL